MPLFDEEALSLTNQSAAGPGTIVDQGLIGSSHTMVVTSGAGVTAGSVQFKGSLDSVNWFNLGAAVSTNAANTTFPPVVISGQPVRYLRADIATVITGGTVSAMCASAGA
jgi:hypothetical protein